jgi:vitamin B12 transporter
MCVVSAGILLCAARTTASAVDTPPELGEMVVSATLSETPVENVGSSVTVITADDIAKMNVRSVIDVLRQIPGVHVAQSGGPGSAAGVFIRGANSEHTLVIVDGIELNDPIHPSRGTDVSNLDPASIERIEVLRGPQSGLYGSDAIGGVIRIYTKGGKEGAEAVVSAEVGSFETYSIAANWRGGDKNAKYSVTASRLGTRGVSAAGEQYAGNTEKDGFENTEVNARLDWSVVDNLSLHVVGQYNDSDTDTDAFEGDYGDDPDGYSRRTQFLVLGGGQWNLMDNKWRQTLDVSYTDTDRKDDGMFGPLGFDSSLFKVQWRNEVSAPGGNDLAAGIEYEAEDGESDSLPHASAYDLAAFVQDQVGIGERIHVVAGGRWDKHEEFGDELTYRVAPSIEIAPGLRVRGSVGTGYKAPSLYQLYAPATAWGPVGNADLDPEKSVGWDIGLEESCMAGRCRIGVTYFENAIRDLIEYNFGYINRPKSEISGVEAYAGMRLVAGLSVNASYTYMNAEDSDTGQRLVRRPDNRAALRADYQVTEKLGAGVEVIYVGERDDNMWDPVTFEPSRVELDPYTLVNASVRFRYSNQVEFFARGENLFDEEYEEVRGFGTTGFGAYGGVKLSM